MASVVKHGEGWRVFVLVGGQRLSKTFKTKREATAWGAAQEASADNRKAGRKLFSEVADHYYKTVSSRKDSPGWERRRLDAFSAYFDGVYIDDIDAAAIGRWRDHRLETVTGSTVQRESNLLRHVFTLALEEWKWITVHPYKGVRLPDHNPPRQSVWTWQLIKRVLRADRAGKTAEAVKAFRIALHTGLRLAEVLRAEYEPGRKVLVLTKTKTTKAGVRVEVPTVRRARKLFPVRFTVGANEASVLFSELLRELMIEGLTFRDARASALTWMSRRMDVMTLARISRHKDLRILMDSYYRERPDQISARL